MITPPPVEPTPPSLVLTRDVGQPADDAAGPGATGQRERFEGVTAVLVSATIHLVLLLIMSLVLKSSVSTSPLVMQFGAVKVADQPMPLDVIDFSDMAQVSLGDSTEQAVVPELRIFQDVPEVNVNLADLQVRPVRLRSGSVDDAESPKDKSSESKDRGVKFFGAHAYGNKFVYVLDISGSMGSGGGQRLHRARVELVRSIDELQSHHSFYVVLYSNAAYRMFWERGQPRLRPATRENKSKVANWIATVQPHGGTYPAAALKIAGDLIPDAVFFLSDGEFVYGTETGVSSAIDRLLRGFGRARPSNLSGHPSNPLVSPKYVLDQYAADIVVHTIAFESESNRRTMEMIAESKGGQHRFIPAMPRLNAARRRAATR